ncbi:MAG: hypothetical protein ACK5AO_10065 [bacterium]|jgi:hypothetical protein
MSNLPALLTTQAYERLVTFAERTGFHALIGRLHVGNLTSGQLADVFKETVMAEFEHNISQQIYVSETAWQVVVDLKDQHIFIINELLNTISKEVGGKMLTDAIKTFLEADPNASIQPMVLETLKKEARQHLAGL